MCYPAVAVANTILDLAATKGVIGMTPMKLQKLLFFAQAWYMKNNPSKKLFPEPILKWQYGPVVGDVYREFSGFRSNPITNYADNADGTISIIPKNRTDLYDFLIEILTVYGKYDAWTLSLMTHAKGTAWDIAAGEIITDEDIKSGIL